MASSEPSPEQHALRGELGAEIQRAILSIPGDQRAVLVLVDVQAMSYDEAAALSRKGATPVDVGKAVTDLDALAGGGLDATGDIKSALAANTLETEIDKIVDALEQTLGGIAAARAPSVGRSRGVEAQLVDIQTLSLATWSIYLLLTTALGIYIPHRLEEGYGLNTEALLRLRREGASLAISVDCGVTAHEPARAAREAGLDLIITDHHDPPEAGEALPPAVAVVHPRLPGSAYPFGELCGAGVAFKLAWAFAVHWCGSKRVGKSIQQVLLDMLPLTALATVADVVPLVNENRTIVSYGLRWIRDTKITGLRALIEAADLMDADIDSHKVGFVLGPRLNACGRMGHADEAVRLLTDATPEEARRIARHLTALNRERQQTERRITEQATRMAQDACMTGEDCRAIVLAHESWHAGVVGIACARLVDRFSRPVFLMPSNPTSH